MKAPDKIYIPIRFKDTDRLAPTWWQEPIEGYTNIAYIRKDALLEWAKGLYEKTMTFVSGDIERDNEIQMFALRISKHIESL